MNETENKILFYCRDCSKVVLNPKKKDGKYEYLCGICNSERVAFGTEKAICDFFNIKEAMLKRMLANQK